MTDTLRMPVTNKPKQKQKAKFRKQNVEDKEVGSEGCVGALQTGRIPGSFLTQHSPKCPYKIKQYTFTFPWLHELKKRRSF